MEVDPTPQTAPEPRRSWRLAIAMGLVGLLLAATGSFMVREAVTVGWDAYRLRSDGVQVTAQVTGLQTRERTGKNAHGIAHELMYEFELPGGDKPYGSGDDWVEVPEATWFRGRETQTVRVDYLRADPQVNRVAATKRDRQLLAVLLLPLGAFCLLIGAGYLLGAWLVPQYPRVPWRRRRQGTR